MTPRKRRCVHVFATFGAGGPQIRAVQLLAHMGPGWQHVIQAMDGCTDAKAQLAQGGAVEFAPPPKRGGLFATAKRQQEWLRAQKPDLVLTYNWGAIESVAAAVRAKLPLVHHEDGFGPEEAQRRLRRRSLLRRLLLRKTPVIVPSAVLQGIAAREWKLAAANVHLLPNGVDLQRFRPPLAAAGSEPRYVVGTVGGLRHEKDHANLLMAVAQLPLVQLQIVGGGALLGELQQQSRELGIADRTTFVGAVADTAPAYRAFALFVLSSKTEQMPIALLEAMASGLPTVATDVGDVRRILPPEAAGCVVPAGNAAALAAAIQSVLADPAAAQRLGLANRARVEQHYEARQCLDRFVALYERTARLPS
jgi:glycosyltransferase involved in cell wall biosynthesis